MWSSTTPEARKEQLARLARAQARGSLLWWVVRYANVQRALVKMSAWAEALSATEREDNDVWVRAIPVDREVDKRRAHLALLGTVVFVLGALCGVALAILRLR
ncbi:hypothetical protein BE17_16910 [Sorangium cellulosum]|uniref:Uncharacterized protein n=1 Tax=Sorangium cellulosum TaxID=56 RepID=A0A150RZM2_SORCE|nr:hypothetical protein BE17_16910 [Sorangium cellulosum]